MYKYIKVSFNSLKALLYYKKNTYSFYKIWKLKKKKNLHGHINERKTVGDFKKLKNFS